MIKRSNSRWLKTNPSSLSHFLSVSYASRSEELQKVSHQKSLLTFPGQPPISCSTPGSLFNFLDLIFLIYEQGDPEVPSSPSQPWPMIKGCGHPLTPAPSQEPLPASPPHGSVYSGFWPQQAMGAYGGQIFFGPSWLRCVSWFYKHLRSNEE